MAVGVGGAEDGAAAGEAGEPGVVGWIRFMNFNPSVPLDSWRDMLSFISEFESGGEFDRQREKRSVGFRGEGRRRLAAPGPERARSLAANRIHSRRARRRPWHLSETSPQRIHVESGTTEYRVQSRRTVGPRRRLDRGQQRSRARACEGPRTRPNPAHNDPYGREALEAMLILPLLMHHWHWVVQGWAQRDTRPLAARPS